MAEQKTQVPPQQIVARLAKISALLEDAQKLAERYREAYYTKVELKVKGTNMNEKLTIECNDYKVTFNTNDIYMYIETQHGGHINGHVVLRNGEGYVGDIVAIPLECWDKLVAMLENLIHRKLDEIAYMRNFYNIYVYTA
jgi:hypothetical protein